MSVLWQCPTLRVFGDTSGHTAITEVGDEGASDCLGICLVIENKSSNRVHLDPTRFVLVTDQRGQMNALNSEQAMP